MLTTNHIESSKNFSTQEKADLVLKYLRAPEDFQELNSQTGISKHTISKWCEIFVQGGIVGLERECGTERPTSELSDDFYKKVVHSFPGNILVSRPDDGAILFRSAWTQTTFGIRNSTSEHWANLEERQVFVDELMATGHVDNMLFTGRKFDDSEFPAQLSGKLIEHEGQAISISTSTDLSRFYTMREEVERANERFDEALEAFDEGLVLWDSDFCFVLENQRMFDMLYPNEGPPRIAQPGDSFDQVLAGLIENDVYNLPEGVPATQIIQHWKGMVQSFTKGIDVELNDGRILSGSSHETQHGGYLMTFKDVTDQRRAEMAEEKANSLLRDAIEALDGGIMLFDSELRLELFNEKANKLFFDDRGTFEPGKTFHEICDYFAKNDFLVMPEGMAKEDWARLAEKDVRAFGKNSELTTAAGRLLLGTSHKTDQDGFLLTFKDVTEQRNAEKAQREADMLLRVIVEACPTTFLVSKLDDGKIIYFPPASRDRFGDIDSTLQFFLDPKDRIAYLNALMPSGSLDDFPVKFRRRDGSIMDGLTSARVTNYNGEDVIVSSTRDISEQLEMQTQLDRQKEIAYQNEKLSALGELLAGVAHELNNPLSIVVGYSLMLQDKIDDPVFEKRIRRIGQAAERCARIVKMFLAMARQRPAEIECCQVNELIESTMDVAGFGFRSSGGRIKLELEDGIPEVAADPDQLAQVVTNLVVNAEQALRDGDKEPKIKVISSFEPKSGRVVIKVRDNGNGIPKKIQSRVFEPFFTTKDVGAGTGVGLAFCHRTISAHNGTLTLHSQGGQGTTFIIRLPVAGASNSNKPVESSKAEKPQNRSVLVVDDEEIVTELMQDILEEHGYNVVVENNPLMAIELIGEQHFDAVLSDMRMPAMNGEEVMKQMISKQPAIANKFAFVTGDIMRGEVATFLEAGEIPYLEKPISPDELLALLTKLFEQNKEPRS